MFDFSAQPPCADAPQCTSSPGPITFAIKEQPNGFDGNDICKIAQSKSKSPIDGVFMPCQKDHFNNQIVLNACYNPNEEHWQFNVNPVEFNVVLGLCPENISQNAKLITDISTIDYCDIGDVLVDLNGYRNNKIYNPNGYIFESLILAHERIHKKDYEEIVKKYFSKVEESLKDYKPVCDEQVTMDEINTEAKKKVNDALSDIKGNVISKWIKKNREPDYEARTQTNPDLRAMINELEANLRYRQINEQKPCNKN